VSEQAALLAAIREHPEDDTPRLAFADWLDEQGGASNEAWAEYIRREIQFVLDFPEVAWSKVKGDAQERAQQLFAKYADEWFPAFFGRRHVLRGASAQIRYSRGFPHEVYVWKNPLRFIERAEKVLDLAPITDLVLNDLDDIDLDLLLEEPWLSRLHKLDLYGYDIPQTDWCTIANCPHLKQLRELMLYYGTLTPEDAAWIAQKNPCPRLKRLHIGFAITDAAIARLFGGKAFTGLEGLELDTGKLSPAGLKAIATAAPLKRLKSLKISFRRIPGMAKIVAGAAFWPHLEELEVARCGLGNAGLAELLAKRTKLQTLEAANNNITTSGALALADSPMLASLTKLDLWGNKIGDKGVAALVGSPKARNLRELHLYDCKLTVSGITAIAESPHLANLRELWIAGNKLDLKGARALAASPHLAGLISLSAGSNPNATARKALKQRFGPVVSF
jgi:uncharacterized protein (TIGR02996 family)